MSSPSAGQNNTDSNNNGTVLPEAGPVIFVQRPTPAAIAVPIVVFFGIVAVLVGGYFAFNHWSRRREAAETRARRAKLIRQQQLEHAERQKAREDEEERQIKGDDWEMGRIDGMQDPGGPRTRNDQSPV